jgi:arylsulfatase A-like enzyme
MSCLRDSGYQTINVGKTHFYPNRANLGFEINHVYANEWHSQRENPAFVSDYHEWLRRQTGGVISPSTEMMSSNSWVPRPWAADESLHPNNWTMQTAIECMEKRDPTRPFFLQIGFHRPHPPYDPPISFYEDYRGRTLAPVPVGDWAAGNDVPPSRVNASVGRLRPDWLDNARRAYYAQISALDHQIGRLILYLQKRDLFEDTIIVFASDHGEMLGDHHMFRKTVPFEGSARVPLIVKVHNGAASAEGSRGHAVDEAAIPAGRAIDHPVVLTDLMPTLLEAARVVVPEQVEGKSLWSSVLGDESPIHEYIHGEHSPCWQYIVSGTKKYAWRSDTGEQWLFNLQEDPQELRNLVGSAEAADAVEMNRRRLARALADRPEDGMSDGSRLFAGHTTPAVRQWLLEPPAAVQDT